MVLSRVHLCVQCGTAAVEIRRTRDTRVSVRYYYATQLQSGQTSLQRSMLLLCVNAKDVWIEVVTEQYRCLG